MSSIKINKDGLNSSITELELASTSLSNALKMLHVSTNLARNGFAIIEEDSLEDYNSYVEDITIAYEKMIGYKTQMNGLVYNLKGIRTIIEEFEQEHANKDIDDLLANVDGGNAFLHLLHLEEKPDGSTLLYFELDGKKVTVSEMVNSFYTYTGASMHANIESRIMSSKVGASFDEVAQKSLLDGVNGFINSTQENGYFSLLQGENLQQLDKDLGTSVGSTLSFSSVSSRDKGSGGQALASFVAVGASLVGAYTLTDKISKEKKYKSRQEVTLSIRDMIQNKLQTDNKKERLK